MASSYPPPLFPSSPLIHCHSIEFLGPLELVAGLQARDVCICCENFISREIRGKKCISDRCRIWNQVTQLANSAFSADSPLWLLRAHTCGDLSSTSPRVMTLFTLVGRPRELLVLLFYCGFLGAKKKEQPLISHRRCGDHFMGIFHILFSKKQLFAVFTIRPSSDCLQFCVYAPLPSAGCCCVMDMRTFFLSDSWGK